MSDDRAGRIAALRARVQKKLSTAESFVDSDENLEEIEVTVSSKQNHGRVKERRIAQVIARRDAAAQTSATRTVAMWFIIAGSILGLMTGTLLLNGNPSDVLSSSLFNPPEHVDLTGSAIEAETGEVVGGVHIRIMSVDGTEELRTTTTNDAGFYRIEGVKVEPLLLVAVLDDYVTIERIIMPDPAGEDPLTMTPGDGVREEGSLDDLDASLLEGTVSLSTLIAILTIVFAFVGFIAASEAKRGANYRRTQYLCGISLFSRGFIIFGPLMVLIGMALLSIAKDQFLDQDNEEVA
ncbi:MAG TPA: carboxypeptidase regulatory-like domain-containing protein [Candidatus Poseidoniales archaeon]|nr:MAG: hypothetical protein CXT69_03400 [Euryarchaeota archaeon]HIG02892.1 carboxypeptidase regulatory-like domain-containing protein [Candidatus Poseidoniales archaeon]HIK78350.1 carboxypeptidase regulatory-like domain-containing protein [Candidatus Poseidoniales archaeon]